MGKDPKRQRLSYAPGNQALDVGCELDEADESDAGEFVFSAPGCLAIDMTESPQTGEQSQQGDSWLQAARAMSASIDEVSTMIRSKATSYLSSTDTFNICFQNGDNNSSDPEYTMTNSDRSILETTVASFAAGMAKQIESLRETVVVEGDHPLITSSELENEKTTHHWLTGPIGHRAGIASCLMQRLKSEIMDPMTSLQMQRERKFKIGNGFSGDEASNTAQNPLKMFASQTEDVMHRSLPPAPWELGSHDPEREQMERNQERDEFVGVYYHGKVEKEDVAVSLETMGASIMPPSTVMKFLDIPKPKHTTIDLPNNMQDVISQVLPQNSTQQLSSLPFSASKLTQQHNDAYIMSSYEEEEAVEQLQRESAALVATYQHSDLEGVQKVERSMVEITQLLSRFTDLITEQQEDIFMIHEQAFKSKENVDKGQDQLTDAATRGEKSKHPMATFIMVMALLLLFFNWILP